MLRRLAKLIAKKTSVFVAIPAMEADNYLAVSRPKKNHRIILAGRGITLSQL